VPDDNRNIPLEESFGWRPTAQVATPTAD